MNEEVGFRRLLFVSLSIVTTWGVFAMFNSSEFYRRAYESGSSLPFVEVVAYQGTAAFVWAVFTPFLVFVAERLQPRGEYLFAKALTLLTFIPGAAFVRAVVGGVVSEVVGDRRAPGFEFIQYSVTHRFHRNVFLIVVIIGITYFIRAQREAAERERNELALRTAMVNAELQRLRASMQPRMMFATLDAIAEKVPTNPVVADRMLIHLGDLLRTMLEFGKHRFVTLGEELEVIDRYFEIEQTRSEGKFKARVDLDEELLGALVPPLVLHAIVESALLTNDNNSPQRLDIDGRIEGNTLIIRLSHDDPKRIPSGEALDETRARLRQAFGDETRADYRVAEGRMLIELKMPLRWDEEEVPA